MLGLRGWGRKIQLGVWIQCGVRNFMSSFFTFFAQRFLSIAWWQVKCFMSWIHLSLYKVRLEISMSSHSTATLTINTLLLISKMIALAVYVMPTFDIFMHGLSFSRCMTWCGKKISSCHNFRRGWQIIGVDGTLFFYLFNKLFTISRDE